MNLDVDFIRAQYPVFANPDTSRWAMFENAGGSYVPRQVVDRLHDFFRYTKVQPYGPFESSIKAGEAIEAGYRAMAGLLGCHPDELTLGPSTTMNFYVWPRPCVRCSSPATRSWSPTRTTRPTSAAGAGWRNSVW